MTDWQLLREYLDHNSQTAFTRLVERQMKLVYWTCRREVTDAQLAEDATQTVFLLLAQKATTLKSSVSISGWLFTTARFVSKDILKREAHRRRCEEEVARTMEQRRSQEMEWQRIEPWLNDGLSALPSTDREALLLRYFDGLSLRELAGEMGTTEVAARQRVSRAIDRLRHYLTGKGIHITSLTLGALLLKHSAHAVPVSAITATLNAIQQMAPGPAVTATTVPHTRLLLKGVDILMEITRRKIIVASIAGILLTTCIGVPILMWHAHGAGFNTLHVTTDFTDNDGSSASPTRANGDPAAAARAEIDNDYRDRLKRTQAGDPIGISAYCSPGFTVSENGITETLAQWNTVACQYFGYFSRSHVSVTIPSFQLKDNEAVVTVQYHIEGIIGKNVHITGLPYSPEGARLIDDRLHVERWQKQDGKWVNISASLTDHSTTIDGHRVL